MRNLFSLTFRVLTAAIGAAALALTLSSTTHDVVAKTSHADAFKLAATADVMCSARCRA